MTEVIGGTFETIQHSLDDGILTLSLHRPDNLNAFTLTMGEEMATTFEAVNHDDRVRAVIVTGSGKAFCAGMDLNGEGNVFGVDETANPTWADLADPLAADAGVRDPGAKLTLPIHNCRKPVIAAINGAAAGIGATMTLAMDARVVSTKARFGLVFGRIGIGPEALSSWFLPRLVGPERAMDLMLSADILDADAMVEAGLAQRTVEPEELLDQARAIADRWTKGRSPVAIALTRQLLRRGAGYESPLQTHRAESLTLFHSSIGDGKEGVAAFVEKRPAEFTGRASEMPEFYQDWMDEDTQI